MAKTCITIIPKIPYRLIRNDSRAVIGPIDFENGTCLASEPGATYSDHQSSTTL